jgi:hypothetical protein
MPRKSTAPASVRGAAAADRRDVRSVEKDGDHAGAVERVAFRGFGDEVS